MAAGRKISKWKIYSYTVASFNRSCKMDTILGLALSEVQELHSPSIFGETPALLGATFSTVTFIIIWYGFSPGHKGFSVKITIMTHPNAYTSDAIPTSSARSCSGDWKPGVPAIIVRVPMIDVPVITWDSPKSVRFCQIINLKIMKAN